MPISVKRLTLPPAGADTVQITIQETYEVEGVGRDTVELSGVLIANRTVPLLEHGKRKPNWETATVVAQFTSLKLTGKSPLFGTVKVTLDKSAPSFGVVTAGKCKAALGIEVSMPKLGLRLKSAEPVQLHSTVTTVPPIGDEMTKSVLPVTLVDVATNRVRGRLVKALITWRELSAQTAHPVGKNLRTPR